ARTRPSRTPVPPAGARGRPGRPRAGRPRGVPDPRDQPPTRSRARPARARSPGRPRPAPGRSRQCHGTPGTASAAPSDSFGYYYPGGEDAHTSPRRQRVDGRSLRGPTRWRLGLSDRNLARLPTTWLLFYVHQRVSPPVTFTVTFTGAGAGQM